MNLHLSVLVSRAALARKRLDQRSNAAWTQEQTEAIELYAQDKFNALVDYIWDSRTAELKTTSQAIDAANILIQAELEARAQ